MFKPTIVARIMVLAAVLSVLAGGVGQASDLAGVKAAKVLRHIGVPYANFVSGGGDGMDVELVKMFAESLGVRYEFVPSSWKTVIGDLTGKEVKATGTEITVIRDVPVKGDLIACGLTMLPWREKIVDFSDPTFPTQVWVLARADAAMKPIPPTGTIESDIDLVKGLLNGVSILGMANTCLEPELYNIEDTGAKVSMFTRNLNEMAPAVINGEAETTLLDVPDALIALSKWPGRVKVIGPVSTRQAMALGFSKSSPNLREAFNVFFAQIKSDGRYLTVVKKYYPAVFDYYPEFFAPAGPGL